MNLKKQQDAAAALRSQLAAGIAVSDAASRLAGLQKDYSQFWERASKDLGNGRQLSEVLGGVWPETSISAIRAGEANGSLVEVLANLVESIKIQRDIRKTARKILYPIGIFVASSLTFIVFALTLVPMISQKLQAAGGKAGELTGIAGIGLRSREFLIDHWLISIMALIAAAVGFYTWASSPATQREVIRILSGLPKIGPALYNLCFGLWARYMAMSCRAGLSTIDALRSNMNVLPEPMRGGVAALINDLEVRNLPLDEAADPERAAITDPRRQWPFYVPHAFAVGERSGQLDVELERVAPELIEIGQGEMDSALWVANTVAMTFAAAVLAGSMVLIYVPMMTGMMNMR